MLLRNITDVLAYLQNFVPDNWKKTDPARAYDRMEKFCSMLGNPQNSYRSIHIGGTSGKGSISTFIASILGTKYRTGLYTSPHLVRINERIKILDKCKMQNAKCKTKMQNSKLFFQKISNRDFTDILNIIIPRIEMMKETEFGPPSYFEIITAMAFVYFKKLKVDIAVFEVGMGGRWDATNVITPLVSVITNIGLDHTEYLGDTVEKIAEEKAGIIKSAIPVISGVKQKSIIQLINAKCKMQNAKLMLIDKEYGYQTKSISLDGGKFDYWGKNKYKNLKIGMAGEHQIENASTAIRAVEALPVTSLPAGKAGFQLSEKCIREGLGNAYISGRFQTVRKNPHVILDGAHNPDKMKALVHTVKRLFPKNKVIPVIAIKRDKNAEEMLKILMPVTKKIMFTEFRLTGDQGNIISYNSTDLLRICTDVEAVIEKDPVKALSQAINGAGKEDIILVTGSLYLIGILLPVIRQIPDII